MSEKSLCVVDCHVHVGLTKYRPIEEFLTEADEDGLTGAVLVQHLGNTDNDYLAECLERGNFAAVGLVEQASQAQTLMERGFRGLRLSPEGLGSPPAWDEVGAILSEHHGVASITGPFGSVVSEQFRAVVERFKNVTFRIEHLGWFKYADDPFPPYPHFSQFLRLAELPNTTSTWSGFLNSATPYPHPDANPYLELTLDAFGADRLMWSGDWNRTDLGPEDYRAAVRHIAELPFLDAEQRRAILGGTAARYFDLPMPTPTAMQESTNR